MSGMMESEFERRTIRRKCARALGLTQEQVDSGCYQLSVRSNRSTGRPLGR